MNARFTIVKEPCSIPFLDLLEFIELALIIRIEGPIESGLIDQEWFFQLTRSSPSVERASHSVRAWYISPSNSTIGREVSETDIWRAKKTVPILLTWQGLVCIMMHPASSLVAFIIPVSSSAETELQAEIGDSLIQQLP